MAIVKWTGGKSWAAQRVLDRYALTTTRVIDPFCGGLALPLALAKPAILSDINRGLINAYKDTQRNPSQMYFRLASLPADTDDWRSEYYRLRDQYNATRDGDLFIWLNRSCFNGLYRENRRGDFNVPVGRYASRAMPTPEDLRLFSKQAAQFTFGAGSFTWLNSFAFKPGDLLILDPPYVEGFNGYSHSGFNDLPALKLLAQVAIGAGASVVAFNLDTPAVRNAYSWASEFEPVFRSFTNGQSGSVQCRELIAWS